MRPKLRRLRLLFSALVLSLSTLAAAAPTDDLLAAAQADDRAGVARALAAGAPVDTRDVDGWSAMMFASAAGNTELVRSLLRAKSDPNQRTKDGQTPLFAAVFAGKVEAVRALLQAGARPDTPLPSGKTALALAKERNRPDLVELLQSAPGNSGGVKSNLASAAGAAAPVQPLATPAGAAGGTAIASTPTGVPDATIRSFLEELAGLDAKKDSMSAARAKLGAQEQQAQDERQRIAAAAQERYDVCLSRVKTCESDCGQRSVAGVLGALRPSSGRGGFGADSQAMLSATLDGNACRANCQQSAACESLKP
jgi:hypothetical protein